MKNNKELFLMSLLATDAADALSRFCGILGRWGCSLEGMNLTRDWSGDARLTAVVGGAEMARLGVGQRPGAQ